MIVAEVTDGDSFRLKTGERVRLLSVDAPKIAACLGKEAKERLTQLVQGKRVRLEDKTRDTYGRLLASVFIGKTLINQIMVEEGLARVSSGATSYDRQLRTSANLAKEAKRGIYSSLCLKPNPPSPNCTIKGNIDQSSGKKYYHLPHCRHYQEVVINEAFGEGWFCREEEVKEAGFVKASGC